MANKTSTITTAAPAEEILVSAVQFFNSEKFATTSQTPRNVTFSGKPGFPCALMCLVIVGFICFVIPGVILYITLIRKLYRLHNLVVTVTPGDPDTDVNVTYPGWASGQVKSFLASLPAPSAEEDEPLLGNE